MRERGWDGEHNYACTNHHGPEDCKKCENVRTKNKNWRIFLMSLFLMEAGFVLYCTSITRRISSGKGNHTNEKLEAKNDKRSPATLQDWRGQPPWRG